MQDRQWSKASVEQATARYQKLRNTLRFLLANQTPSHDPTLPYALTDYDQYWVNKTKECLRDVQTYLKESQFHLAVERAHSWSETLSSVCFNAAKDRLYCAKENSPERWGLEKALHMLLGLWLEVLELLCPRTKDESLSFVTVNTDFSEELFCSEDMTTLLDWRENHGPSLEAQSVPRHLLCVYTPLFKWSERATADALGVGEVRYTTRPQAPTISTHPLCPRCRRPGMMLENWCTTCEARRKS